MSERRRANLYLVHQETSQRYPVGESIVIGRNSGDILFPQDSKMSKQHCRLFRTEKGMAVEDFGTPNGTYIDGFRLASAEARRLPIKGRLECGEQSFLLLVTPLTKSSGKQRKKKKAKRDWFATLAILLTIGGLIAGAWMLLLPKAQKISATKIESPLEIVEQEMRNAFADYMELGKRYNSGSMPDREFAENIRQRLLPQLTALHSKTEVLRPAGEWEKQKIEANRRLLSALHAQLTAMATYADNHDSQSAQAVQDYGALAETIKKQISTLEQGRKPSSFNR